MKKQSKSQKLQKAHEEHQKFLTKMGVNKEQLQKTKAGRRNLVLDSWRKSFYNKLESRIENKDITNTGVTGQVTGVFANLHKEPEHVRKAILEKKARVMPLYNKGGYQLASETEDMTQIGARTRRP